MGRAHLEPTHANRFQDASHAVFLAAVEQADRAAFLDRECGDDVELRRRVEALLKANDEPASYLDQPPLNSPDLRNDRLRPHHRKARLDDRAVQAQGTDRRRRLRPGVRGRAAGTGEAQGRAQGHQAGHGHPRGHGPVRGRAASAGADGSSEHRAGAGCRGDRLRPAVLRHGTGPRHSHHGLLRSESTCAARPAGLVRHRLPGRAARASKGHHPPRHQAVECAGHVARRQAGGQGHRLRRRQGDQPATHRAVDLHATSRR